MRESAPDVSLGSVPGYARPVQRPGPSSAQFGMDFEFDVGSSYVALRGELDSLSTPTFAATLASLVDRGVRVVAIDLSELRFCSIGGLRAMAELAARLHAVDGRVEIVAPAILTRMLELDDLGSLFSIRDSTAVLTPAVGVDARRERPAKTSRPRVGSTHRLPTGT